MKRDEKTQSMNEMRQRLEESSVAVMTQYVGINVEQVTELRKKLRTAGVTFKVYKNTLAQRVLDDMGVSDAGKLMDGPTAWAFSKDPVAPAKILKDFAKEAKMINMVGGILEGRPISKAQLEALSNLPPRDALLSQVVGTIAAPLRNLVGVLAASPRSIVNVLDQIKKQKEEAEAGQPAA